MSQFLLFTFLEKKTIEFRKGEVKKLKVNLDKLKNQISLLVREDVFLQEMINFTLNQNH